METRKLPLRILYTVSGSQYILARSSSLVPVVVIPPLHTGSHYDHHVVNIEQPEATASTSKVEPRPEFGTAPLKTCLDAICTSSPELVQDKRRDFSVYVLDPLESNSAPARVNIPNAQASDPTLNPPDQSRGLAVGLGLMSWALMPDEKDSAPVTGTVIKLPTGQEALEVIFALKETVAMEKASLPAALRTWGLPPEPISKASRANVSLRPKASASSATQNHSNYSTHFPILNSSEASSSTSTPSPSYPGQITADVTTLATIASIQMRSQHKRAKANKAKKPPKTPFINPQNSEADRLLLTHYVGPEKKKAGRPPNAAASGSRSNKTAARAVPEASVSTFVHPRDPPVKARPPESADSTINRATHPTNSKSGEAKASTTASQEPPSNPFSSAPLIRAPRDPEPQSLLNILAFLSASSSSPDPNTQNTALLAALSAIDSSSQTDESSAGDNPPGPLLVNALRELISAVAQRPPLPTPVAHNSQPPVSSNNRNHSHDDDIVLLDKENVNPIVFRRPSERIGKSLDAATPAPASTLVAAPASGQPNAEAPAPVARGLTARTNTNVNTAPVAPAPTPISLDNGVRRKRTLSDFMDEREASREKGKTTEREWVERRDAHRYAHSSPKRNELSAIRHYPRLASDIVQPPRRASSSYYRTGMEPWSSPPRPSGENHRPDENSPQRPITIEDSPGPSKVSASSPARPAASKSRRPYVVPAWARTSTSTQPRLSEEAIRALEAEEKKKEEMKAARKRGALRAEKEKKKKRVAKTPSPLRQQATSRPKPTLAQCPPPVTVAGDYPVFAITSAIQERIAAFSTTPAPSEPTSPRASAPALPCTPPRKGHSDLFSPAEDGSLFTPMPGQGFSNSKTPTGFGSVGRVRKTPLQKTPKVTAVDGNDASGEESDDDFEDALNRELDSALDELDLPSSSLPTVSSDVEMENEESALDPPSLDEDGAGSENSEDTDMEIPKRQHWVGLPPSSPPPPTSPMLMPQDDESDDTMLPAVTSDVDPCLTDSDIYSDSFYTNEPSTCTDEELAEYLDSDFASIFAAPVEQPPTFGSDSAQASMDLFDQFTNHNAQSDGPEMNPVSDPNFDILQNGLTDFDLTEFWETFKPLLQDQNGGGADDQNTTSSQTIESQAFDPMTLDHVKLAEDVQALFSGCVM
ncbi:hypothetical protein DXG01_010094 [Tephrocybe rancida]|nr:hypothetical protein DXG01_010094 [Tephrocybe rancida]